jgi:hypothetical protein
MGQAIDFNRVPYNIRNMNFIRNQMLYTPVEEAVTRQYIDARATYTALVEAVQQLILDGLLI